MMMTPPSTWIPSVTLMPPVSGGLRYRWQRPRTKYGSILKGFAASAEGMGWLGMALRLVEEGWGPHEVSKMEQYVEAVAGELGWEEAGGGFWEDGSLQDAAARAMDVAMIKGAIHARAMSFMGRVYQVRDPE